MYIPICSNDCKLKNITTYRDKSKEQVLSTVQLFRSSGIINKQIHGNIFGINGLNGLKQTILVKNILQKNQKAITH